MLLLLLKGDVEEGGEEWEESTVLAEEFDFAKIGRSPARFDEVDLTGLNAALVHDMAFETARERLAAIDPAAADQAFWQLVRENCETVGDAARFVPVAFGEIAPVIDAEDRDFITAAAKLLPDGEMTPETWKSWTDAIKAETGRKGRGLFMPLRKVLTGMEHGPDVGAMLVLMGRDRAAARLA